MPTDSNLQQSAAMLEILILLSILFLAMYNRRATPRRRYNLRKVRAIPQIALATTANTIVVTQTCFPAADGAYRMISCSATWTLKEIDLSETTIMVGYAHGDYTVTEIKEAIEIANSISVGDKIAQEKSNRLVRIVGTFSGHGSGVTTSSVGLNDGRPIKTRLNWFIPIGKTFNIFAYNDTGVTLAGGMLVDANVVGWVKDT